MRRPLQGNRSPSMRILTHGAGTCMLLVVHGCHPCTPCTAGNNYWGQLGVGSQRPSDRFVPIMRLPANVVALQAGGSASGAICEDGTVFMWGRNDHGMLGLGHNISQWAPVRLDDFIAVHPGACEDDSDVAGLPAPDCVPRKSS